MTEAYSPAAGELAVDELLQEACGVVGVLDPYGGLSVGNMAYTGLLGLQHRGEGAAGIFNGVWHGNYFAFRGVKDTGLVTQVFPDGAVTLDAQSPRATLSVGHVRWATSGDGTNDPFFEAQPFTAPELALAQNGHIEGMRALAARFGIANTVSDGDALTQTLGLLSHADNLGTTLGALHELCPQLDGGYSLVVAEHGRMHGVRDPWGTRPLWLGRLANGAVMLASEQPVLHETGRVTEEREIAPGEIVTVSPDGEVDFSRIKREGKGGMCALEGVYFARTDGILNGLPVSEIRFKMGQLLGAEQPAEADIVIGVPDSGTMAAMGYADASGIPYRVGISRNPYVSRTFIQADPEVRAQMVKQKLRPIRSVLKGKRVVVVDDSIVRGTSTKTLADILYEAGAEEVHYRISSAPFVNPCFSGTAISKPESLFARRYPTREERLARLGADSLGYLSTEAIARAMGRSAGTLCMACMDGYYPFDVPAAVPVHRRLLPLVPTVRR